MSFIVSLMIVLVWVGDGRVAVGGRKRMRRGQNRNFYCNKMCRTTFKNDQIDRVFLAFLLNSNISEFANN